jgi:hypothetical protein
MRYKILSFVALALLAVAVWQIHCLREVRGELIELNHDKSVYIDAGCRGRYQGAEEIR